MVLCAHFCEGDQDLIFRNALRPAVIENFHVPTLHFFRTDRNLKPVFAAAFMGAVVALSLLWSQQGIHVSGVFALLCPPAAVNDTAAASASSCSIHSLAANRDWIGWMVLGLFVGAFLTALWRSRGLRFAIERGQGVQPVTRLVWAAAGGLLVGAGAALAGGCTSSIGLTGSAVFSVAAFVFLGGFLLGVGLVAGGYGPGTALTGAAGGRMDAFLFFLMMYPGNRFWVWLEPQWPLNLHTPLLPRNTTLQEPLGTSPFWILGALALACWFGWRVGNYLEARNRRFVADS